MFRSLLKAPVAAAEEKSWSGAIAQGADAMSKRRDLHAQMLRFPTGEAIIEDNGGGLSVRDSLGNIVRTISRNQQQIEFKYDGTRLIEVSVVGGGKFRATADLKWEAQQKDGSFAPCSDGFRLLQDGTLRLGTVTPAQKYYFRDLFLDGSIRIADERGRTLSLKTDFEVQRQRLFVVLDNLQRERLINSDQRQSMCDAFHALARRVLLEEVTQVQAAQTIFYLARMLESSGRSPLGAQVCFMLAHEVMFFAALPDMADRTDGLGSLIQQIYRHEPARAAMIVADMSMYKRYVTASGVAIQYNESLMHPRYRKVHEWSDTIKSTPSFPESNDLIRVVLVNVVERIRLAQRTNDANMSLLDKRRRAFTTKEFGRIFDREFAALYQEVTGKSAEGIVFAAKPRLCPSLAVQDLEVINLTPAQLPLACSQ